MMEGLLEYIVKAVGYPIGWPIVKLLTLGKYPLPGSWFSEIPSAQWTTGIGVAVLMIFMMALLGQFAL